VWHGLPARVFASHTPVPHAGFAVVQRADRPSPHGSHAARTPDPDAPAPDESQPAIPPSPPPLRPAVFLDRDGTIIEDRGYVAHPDQVRLLPGVGDAIRRLRDHGYLVVVVSNQSGVARGYFDETALQLVHERMVALLVAEGAALDAAYYCPFLDAPEAVVERFRRVSHERKPAPGMILRAARRHGIDLARSWMVGDSPSDVEAGRRAGCRTILLTGTVGTPLPGAVGTPRPGAVHATHTARALPEAVDHILA
jgi:D-glycero-D-manno-heptose 1,7-bisphosphate phosphatase